MATIDIDPQYSGVIYNGGGGNLVERTVLDNGVRILTEVMPGQKAVSIGFWIGVGSRDEQPSGYGSTHFLEHLLFKGSANYTGWDISEAFDRVGGDVNAATAKESTCYHARVINTNLAMAVDILTDMVTAPLLESEQMDTERGVILEELAVDSDDPAYVVHESLAEQVLPGHPLGRSIGGTPEVINSISREDMVSHYNRWYRPEQLVITAAGGLDHKELVQTVSAALSRSGWMSPESNLIQTPAPRRDHHAEFPVMNTERLTLTRPVEQTAVMVGGRGLNTVDPRRFAMTVMNVILGGGMTSRLFQEIRERRGLAYSTYSFAASYSDLGYFGMYAGCHPAKADEVIEVMSTELDTLAQKGVTADELERAHGQIAGNVVLGLENTEARMSRLGRAELVTGQYIDLDGSVARITGVSADEVVGMARLLADSPRTQISVGPDNR
ncbi:MULTISPECIES: M16 family metallopeptidase [Auritidibacter]|uniref:M16 family metallopeptidase n=1 Tax=Auritidibacter TaxID=1160973 RepID=UPI000D739CBA|nr:MULTISPECIES: pitrilysin family protein [Auritidibacter]NIH72291.1 putative Zn-dependent peptidase [Auritidibacter ignavus]PXA78957.1 peptidase M16 [Auritidibacter sp. NML120636]RMX23705.1 insulinase family protein [Auritidibacter ignavus]WGH82461.1 pitrilysin family protein [Auritidibacter ignavus]